MRLLISSFVALAILAVGCGSDSPVATGQVQGIDGEWLLADAAIDGQAVVPIDGYPITLEIDGDSLRGNTGCNIFGGPFTVDGSALELGDISITERACADAGPMGVEGEFMQGFWRANVVERTGPNLLITGPDVSLEFTPVAPIPPADLVGTTWQLDTFIDGEAASSTSTGAESADITFSPDGTFAATTGCRELAGSYVVDDDRLQLAFSMDDFGCVGVAGEQDVRILGVLEQEVSVEINEQRLTLMGDNGSGLSYNAG